VLAWLNPLDMFHAAHVPERIQAHMI